MRAKRITLIAMLTAFALTIFVIEAQIPPLVPIPGIKLGLANIITLFALMTIGRRDALIILILRVILGSAVTGNIMSCMYSLAGGLVCFAAKALTRNMFKKNMIWCISILGAIGHNIGQILVAVVVTNTIQVAWYLPVLMISAVITGLFTGLITQYTLKHGHVLIYKMIGAKQ